MERDYISDNVKEVLSCQHLEKIDELIVSANKMTRLNPAKSADLSNEALELSRQAQYKKGMAKSLCILGKTSYVFGNSEKAIHCLMDAMQIVQDEDLKEDEADILNVLGAVNIHLTSYNVALEYYMKSLGIIRENGFKTVESRVLNNIGEIYKQLKNYETALDYYTQSLEICDSIGADNVKCVVLQNIGEIYCYLSDYDKAKYYTEKSLDLSCKIEDKLVESACLHQLGKIAYSQNNSEEALTLFLESLKISEVTEERYFMIDEMIDIHEVLVKKDNNKEAIEYLEKALTLAQEITSKEMIMKVYSCLAKLHEKIEQFDKALYYYKKFHDTEKSGTNEDIADKLKNITLQFKMEQSHQEKEIYRLKNVELKEKTQALEKKTAELMESYNNMKIVSKIGQVITSSLDFEKILNLVYKNINNLMPAYTFGIALYDKDTGEIEYGLFIENSKRYPGGVDNISNKDTWAAWCIRNKKEILVNDIEKEFSEYIQNRKTIEGISMESLIYCPLIFEDEVLGVITVQSTLKNTYTQYNLDTLKALASYVATAIRNAQKSAALEKANEKLLSLSNLDGLTEIPNRRYYDKEIEALWKAARFNNQPISLMLIDVDKFKEYNDNYGHLAGDYCLQQIAKTLQTSSMEGQGFAARYGGDEFVAVFPNTSSETASKLAETIKNNVKKLNIEHKFSKVAEYITLTIGVCTIVPSEELSVSQITSCADKALYAAKQKGRNRIEGCQGWQGDVSSATLCNRMGNSKRKIL